MKHSPMLLREYGSSVAVHIKSHKDIQALLDSASFSWVTVPAGPYARWPCTCSGEGSQPGSPAATQHFHRSVGGCRARGKRGGCGATQKAYQPWLRKGMLGLRIEGVPQGSRNICWGTHRGSVHRYVAGTYQRRQGSDGDAPYGPPPKNEFDFSTVQPAPPRQFSPRSQTMPGCSFISTCSSTSITVS